MADFHTPEFDGPLDLLLKLISDNEINIYNLDVSLITEQFLQYIEEHGAELGELSEFYRMAADLLYIKSRLLLPVDTELDEEYEDPRKDLVDKLIEYQKFKKYTDLLLSGGTGDRLYIKRNENFFAVPYDDSDLFKDVDVRMLLEAFVRLASKTNPAKIFNVYEEVSIDEKKALLMELLDAHGECTLEDLIVHTDNRMHIACSFLAILEMAKDRLILIAQEEEYGEIVLKKREEGWEPEFPDENDDLYDKIVASSKKGVNYSIITKEAEDLIRKQEQEETPASEEVLIGEEEEIPLEDDD